MNKEFIPYEQALELKKLGFNEICSFYYKNKVINDCINAPKTNSVGEFISENFECTAPLYQQAFRWFREKHSLHSYIEGPYPWFRFYIHSEDDRCEGHKHLLFEETEIACLKKLIEIVKNK